MLIERFNRVNHIPSDLKWLNELQATIPVAEGSFQLLRKCGYLGAEGVLAVNEALKFAHEYHSRHSIPPEKAIREDGSEYTTHLIAVTEILADLKCDNPTLQAALLHDTRENTSVSEETIMEKFGTAVVRSINTVTKVAGSAAETMVKVLEGLADDPRPVLIKLADRLHNMRTIGHLPKEKQRKIALQTLQVFAPIAREVGLTQVAHELYDLSYSVLWRDQYLHARRIIGTKYVPAQTSALFAPIGDSLIDSSAIEIQVLSPPVNMLIQFERDKAIVRDQDQIPIEIICITEEDFAQVIQFFQKHFRERKLNDEVIDGRLKLLFPLGGSSFSLDIYNPEGYAQKEASLATLFQIPDGSEEFNRRIDFAEAKLVKPRALLGQYQEGELGPEAILRYYSEVIKHPLIGVVTPVGEIRVLSAGATALDFAFSISRDLGQRAIGVVINGNAESLSAKLNEGDKVEILAQDSWSVEVAMLDYIFNKSFRETIKRSLVRILRTDEDSRRPAEMRRSSYEKDLGIMRFENLDDLGTIAQKIRADAENRGEKKLMDYYKLNYNQIYQRRYHKTSTELREEPIIDLDRGWQSMSKKSREKYQDDFQRFLIECGLNRVSESEQAEYIEAVIGYEHDKLRTIELFAPDRPQTLARLLSVAGICANLVGLNISPNSPDKPSGVLKMVFVLELDAEETYQKVSETLNLMAAMMKIDTRRGRKNRLEDELKLSLSAGDSLLPDMAVLGVFGLTAASVVRHGNRLIIKPKRLRETTPSQRMRLLERVLGNLRKMSRIYGMSPQ